MDIEQLIYQMNPKLNEVVENYVAPNYDRHEAPIGIANYVFNTDHSTFDPYPDTFAIDTLIDNHKRMESQKISPTDEHDILKESIVGNAIVGLKRQVAKKQADNAVYTVQNNGQQYADHIIGNLYNNAMEDVRLQTDMAQNITSKNMEKQNKKIDVGTLLNKARLRAKRNK